MQSAQGLRFKFPANSLMEEEARLPTRRHMSQLLLLLPLHERNLIPPTLVLSYPLRHRQLVRY